MTLLAHQRPTNSRAAHAPSLRVAERLDRLDSAEDEEEESLPTVDATPSAAASPTPPKGLLRYPALARFLNCHLAALNQLRMCAPLDARPILHAALRGHVQRAARALSAYRVYEGEQRLANGTAATQSAADDLSSSGDIHATLGETLCGEFASTLVPHLCACFGAIFDSADGGILSAELRADLAAIGIFEVPFGSLSLRNDFSFVSSDSTKLTPLPLLASGAINTRS